jgi:hypothetical protein
MKEWFRCERIRTVFCWWFLEEGQPFRAALGLWLSVECGFARNGRNKINYSMWFNSGRRASSSASLEILRGCLGSSAMRVRS